MRSTPNVTGIDGKETIEEENDYSNFMNELIKLVPISDADKKESLKEIIWFLSAILYGDDIHSFSAINYHSEYAKDAISKLIKYAQINSIENFGVIIENLRQELENLQSQKASLSEEVSTLGKESIELKEQTDILKKEKEELESYKSDLSTEIEELESIAINYEQKIKNYDSEQSIIWEPISENHPIYGLSSNTIVSYIEALEKDYADKTNVSTIEALNTLYLETPALFRLKSLLCKDLDGAYEYMTVREILEKEITSPYYNDLKQRVKSIVKDIKTYKMFNKNNNSLNEIKRDEVSKNVLRELQMQKKLLEAMSRQKIAEQQLEIVISALSKNIPKDEIMSSINDLSYIDYLPEEKQKRKKY